MGSAHQEGKAAAEQFPGQQPGEEVVMLFRQHPLVMRKALFVGLGLLVVGILPLDFPQVYEQPGVAAGFVKVAVAIGVVVLGIWFYRWIGWYYTVYIVTTRRILAIAQRGLFNRQVDEWQLEGITNLNYRIGGFQAVLFGYGDITARTYVGDLEMKTIHGPAQVHGQLMQAVLAAGGGRTGSTADGD